MRRRALLVAGVAALAAAHALARPLARPAGLRAPAWAVLLGPLRPYVAELERLRFEARRGDAEALGQLEGAWRALALEPARAPDFVHFGWYFVFDAVHLARSKAERDACVRAGFEILAAGRALHPASARLAYAEGLALDHLARRAPERLAAAGLPAAMAARGRALERFERALALAGRDDRDRAFVRLALALCAGGLLEDPATPDELRARARAAAQRLLEDPDLAPESRAALRAALEREDRG